MMEHVANFNFFLHYLESRLFIRTYFTVANLARLRSLLANNLTI